MKTITFLFALLFAMLSASCLGAADPARPVMANTSGAISTPLRLFQANVLAGTNVVIITNADGSITIAGTASGSGDMTSNQVVAVVVPFSAGNTNHALALAQACSNLSWAIGQAGTNYSLAVSNSLTTNGFFTGPLGTLDLGTNGTAILFFDKSGNPILGIHSNSVTSFPTLVGYSNLLVYGTGTNLFIGPVVFRGGLTGDGAGLTNLAADPRTLSVQADASATPTTTLLTLSASQNAFRVWTSERPVDEAWLDIAYRTNGGTVVWVREYRWQGRILSAPPGAAIQLGITNGNSRTLWLAPMTVATNLPTPSGVTNWAACDRAGPPLWSPVGAHVTMPSNGMAFTVLSNRSEVPFFVSEFDGWNWSPLRWYILPTNENLTILATFKTVALANYAGTPLQVVAPTGSTVGGESRDMELVSTRPSSRDIVCSTADELTNAIAMAVSGDVIVLNAGTFALSTSITSNSFTANRAAGFVGMDGITIRGSTSDKSQHVLTGSDPWVGWWWLIHYGSKPVCNFANLTFDFTSSSNGMLLNGGNWRFQNVRWTGCTNHFGSDWHAAFSYYTADGQNEKGSVWMLGCAFDHIPAAGPAFYCDYGAVPSQASEVGLLGKQYWPTNNSRIVLINTYSLWNTNSRSDLYEGNPTQGKSLQSDGSARTELYGCHFGKATTNSAVVGLHDGRIFGFFSKFSDGPNIHARNHTTMAVIPGPGPRFTNNVHGIDLFASKWICGGSDNLTGYPAGGYVLFSSITRSNSTLYLIGGGIDGDCVDITYAHNRFSQDQNTTYSANGVRTRWIGNVFANPGKPLLFIGAGNYATNDQYVVGNTFSACGTAVDWSQTNGWYLLITNCAFAGNTYSIANNSESTGRGTNFIRSNYNLYDPVTTYAGAMPWGSNDTNGVEAAFSVVTIRPTAGGNCDDTGIGLGWCGDSDPYGQTWLFHPARAPRGARAIQRWWADAVVIPDVW